MSIIFDVIKANQPNQEGIIGQSIKAEEQTGNLPCLLGQEQDHNSLSDQICTLMIYCTSQHLYDDITTKLMSQPFDSDTCEDEVH